MVSYRCNNETGPKVEYCEDVEVAQIGAAEGSKREMKNLKVSQKQHCAAQTTLWQKRKCHCQNLVYREPFSQYS